MDRTAETVAGKSGQEIGSRYVERVRAYLTSGDALPLLPTGDLNVSAIADKAKVPRQSMYKNGTIRNLIETARANIAALAQRGLEAPAVAAATSAYQEVPELSGKSKQQQMLERRVQALEKANISIVAENAELRRQLRAAQLQLGREDMVIESGRRIPPLPNA